MRKSLVDLVRRTIIFRYNLPNNKKCICKSKVSTDDDFCYSSNSNNEMSEIIYNSVIEYSFNEFEIQDQDFDLLHRRALTRRLKFNEDAKEEQKLRYGFYGEVVLCCLLEIFHKSPPLIARGHFYNILENGETKGYDAYHILDNQGNLELWFGEVKFYGDFKTATTGPNGALTNIAKAISDKYLNNNLIAISERINDLALAGSALKPVLDEFRSNPDINIPELAKKYNIKLIYPILILFDEKKKNYDLTIKDAIKHIEDNAKTFTPSLSISLSIFFMLIPVENTKIIKSKVIEWIRERKPLMS